MSNRDLLEVSRQRLAAIRAEQPVADTVSEISEISEISTARLRLPLLAAKADVVRLRCWICADLSTGEVDGRHYCDRHAPTTPTTRALAEACELYERLSAEWDALIDSGQRAPDHLKCGSSQAAVTVADLCQQTREADR